VTKKRTVGEQVRSGFRIVGLILLVFAVFVLLEISLTYAVGLADPHMGIRRLFGAVVASGLMLFMFRTTRYWAPWLFMALAFGLVRLSGGLLLGPYFSKPLARSTVAVWMLYAGAAVALTARYVRRRPRGSESFGLVAFVVGVELAAVYNSQDPLWAGLAALGLAELIQWLHPKKIHPQSEALESRPPA
jgi:hypothetical protein